MADEFVLRIIPESDSGSPTRSGGGAIGGLGGSLGKLGGLIAIAGVALSVLKPMLPMVKGLGKILGEFLRPIADVIMMLLAPILSLMRPLLITFKALMAPFKQAAMVGIAAGQKLIGQGMAVGGEVGEELVSAGFAGSMASASLMLSGFMDVLFSPLKNIEVLGIGDAISNAMDTWESAAIGGILKVQAKSQLIDSIWENIGDVPVTVIQDSFSTINTYVEELKENVGGFNIDNFQSDLDTVKEGADIIFDPLVKLLGTDGNLATYVSESTGIMNDFALEFPNTAEMISSGIMGVMEEWQTAINNMSIEKQASLMLLGAEALIAQLEGIEKTTFGDKVKDTLGGIGHNIGEILTLGFLPGRLRTLESDKEQWINDVASARKTVTDDYLAMFPTVGKAQKEGLMSMLTDMNLYFGNSLIPDSYNKGLDKMNISTEVFTNSLSNFASRTEDYADKIDDLLTKSEDAYSDIRRSQRKADAASSAIDALV